MNKKIISIILAAAAASSASPLKVLAEPTDIRIFLNGNEMYLSDNVEVFNNSAMVPAKNFMEGLGYYVEWNEIFQTLTASKFSTGFVFNVNNSEYTINGNIKQAALIPAVIRNRVYISLDDVIRDIGLSYVWDNDNRSINIEGELINPTQPPLVKLPDEEIPKNLFDKKTSGNNRNNTTADINKTISANKNNTKNSGKLSFAERLSPQLRVTPAPSTSPAPNTSPAPSTSLPSASPTSSLSPTPTPKPVSPYKCYSRYPTVPNIQNVVTKLDLLYFENTVDSSTYYYSFARNERDNIGKMYTDALKESGFEQNSSESRNKFDVYERYDIKVIFNNDLHSITIQGTPNTAPTKGSGNNIFTQNKIPEFSGKYYNDPIPFYEAYLEDKIYVYKFVAAEDDAKTYNAVLKEKASNVLSIKDKAAEFMFGSAKVTTQLIDYNENIIQNSSKAAVPTPTPTPKPSNTPRPTKTPAPVRYNKLGVTPTPAPTASPSTTPEISQTPAPLLDVSKIDKKDRKIFTIKIAP